VSTVYESPWPLIRSIFHPSDFSKDSETAFAHALKLALIAKADLSILHVAEHRDEVDWHDFPGVRETLERWKLLPEGSSRSAVSKLGVRVRKVVAAQADPVKSALVFLDQHPADLVVLAAHQHEGTMGWLQKRVAEPLARQAGIMTLFVPHGVKGFVSLEDGSVSLKRFLIPVDKHPSPQAAVDAAARAANGLNCEEADFTIVFVGEKEDMPDISTYERPGWNWNLVSKQGDPVDAILQTANDFSADLVVMTTAGHHGFLDALRGSTTEQVMRGANCPLLAIPADGT